MPMPPAIVLAMRGPCISRSKSSCIARAVGMTRGSIVAASRRIGSSRSASLRARAIRKTSEKSAGFNGTYSSTTLLAPTLIECASAATPMMVASASDASADFGKPRPRTSSVPYISSASRRLTIAVLVVARAKQPARDQRDPHRREVFGIDRLRKRVDARRVVVRRLESAAAKRRGRDDGGLFDFGVAARPLLDLIPVRSRGVALDAVAIERNRQHRGAPVVERRAGVDRALHAPDHHAGDDQQQAASGDL